jgi:hypothetical protein
MWDRQDRVPSLYVGDIQGDNLSLQNVTGRLHFEEMASVHIRYILHTVRLLEIPKNKIC